MYIPNDTDEYCMHMQEIELAFEKLGVGVCVDEDCATTHDTLEDIIAAQGRPIRTVESPMKGMSFRLMAVVDAGELRYCYHFFLYAYLKKIDI